MKSPLAVALVLLLAIGGVGLVLIATEGLGPGITTDSVAYLSAADSFFHTGQFVMYDGTPLVRWPPGFPAALAGIRITGVSALTAAQLVNAVGLGLIIALTGLWLLDRLEAKWPAILAAAALLVSIPLINLAITALSEILFSVIVIVYLIALDRSRQTLRVRDTVIAGALAAAAVLTRYVGLGLLLGGAIVTWGFRRDRQTLLRLVAFSIAGMAPVGAWFLRNRALAGTTRGGWIDPLIQPAEVITQAIDAVATTVLPPTHVPLGARVAITMLTAVALGALLVYRARTGSATQRERVRQAGTVAAVVLSYFAFWLGCAFVVMVDVDQRMFAPMYPAVVVLLAIGLDSMSEGSTRHRGREASRALGVAVAIGLLMYPAWYSWNTVRYHRSAGGGGAYNTQEWRSSELIRAVAALPPGANILSNAPGALYLWAGRGAREFGARQYPAEPSGFEKGLHQLANELETAGPAYVAVFDSPRVKHSYVYTKAQLSDVAAVQPVSVFSDGALYRAHTRNGSTGMSSVSR